MARRNYFSHETAIVEHGASIGKNTRIWHFAHVRDGASVGSNCTVGKDCFIDTSVTIGDNVKIQNGVSIYKGVHIDDDVFVGPNVTFTNDPYPRAFSQNWKILPTHIKKGASIGANATLVCGISIGQYAMVAAGSVVTKDIPDYCLVAGNPARIKDFVCVCGSKLKKMKKKNKEFLFKCAGCEKEILIPLSVAASTSRK